MHENMPRRHGLRGGIKEGMAGYGRPGVGSDSRLRHAYLATAQHLVPRWSPQKSLPPRSWHPRLARLSNRFPRLPSCGIAAGPHYFVKISLP
ncbi:protein of unknown function [Cupriavidus taiwanensis]|uniref:Uncharacterized protein n=1 Tax=Cupriavidus taiwanensis TaxID=164546 RepID=A0A7Z7JAU0_9BURK|nr:protein of unknown function [Cupriavidus taiwanensis]SOZ05887.1 hypothetical protein CBM2595_A80572 [Cupriavidus taiwanensis]SOZ07872.1 hypothetical protein CBM2597_A90478 [Cupriavidus taiwanensis]SPC15908.1 hypothetical protein CBM2594_A70473 [Cupriavidus taiwanensis]SPD40580.1 protein of unknown function [Cupriavidus taiwanensis]